MIVSLLQNVPLFQELSEEDLLEIAPLFTEKKVEKTKSSSWKAMREKNYI